MQGRTQGRDKGYSLKIHREDESLTQRVVTVMREAIVSGEFRPGHRLVERTLCELTGVSRTAVREALRTLEAQGLVINIPNHGPSVATIDAELAKQLYEVREVLEAKAVLLFLERMTGPELEAMENAIEAMERAHAVGDAARVNAAKRAFYDVLVEGCGNQIIQQVLSQLFAKIAILRHMTMGQANRTSDAIAELKDIYVALRARDADAAKEASVRHVKAAAKVALAANRLQPVSGPS